MVFNFMQIIKDEKVSKGRALQKLPSQTEFQASVSPQKTENEQSLQSSSTKGLEVCSSVVLSDYTCTYVTGDSPYS